MIIFDYLKLEKNNIKLIYLDNVINISYSVIIIICIMALTSHIRSSEGNFKLSQKLVEALSSKFNFSQVDGWNHVCSMSVESCIRRFRKEKRKNDPTKCVKKPRTAFSFFTQEQRKSIQDNNPTAKFGELSRLVSIAWKSLSDSQLKLYKEREVADRQRYNTELQACRERLAAEASSTVASSTPVEATAVVSTPSKKSSPKKQRSSSATTPTPTQENTQSSTPTTSPKKEKRDASRKEKRTASTPVPEPTQTATPVATPSKKEKKGKSVSATA